MPGVPTPRQALHSALSAIDGGLENVSLAADAISQSLSSVPPTTSDYREGPRTFLSKGINAVRSQVKRGPVVSAPPFEAISALLDGVEAQSNGGIDDRKKALEYGLVLLSRSPPDSKLARDIEHKAIRLLYRDLPHPPSTQMGPKYQFRSADGSGNSPFDSQMGRSFTPYSRSCTSTHPLPASELPSPGVIFDSLIKRDKFVPHPAGLSGLFFNFATTVIHSVFRTSRNDWNINETSSYVDLGILYGNTQAHQDTVRNKDGRGKIWPDVFAETRLLSLPPGVSALIVVFNRNHNYIADMLLRINERKTWSSDISKLSPEAKAKQDEEIFQTARLINSGAYANVVLSDYLAGILGTVRDGSSWSLDIMVETREADHTILERGTGNSCSVEFNTLYRLHPSMSQADEKYTEQAFSRLFGQPGQNLDFDTITPHKFETTITQLTASRTVTDANAQPKTIEELKDDSKPVDLRQPQYNIPGMTRDPRTQKYDDRQLAEALQNATSVPAGAFKARGVPHVMRVIEMLGIEQARNWGCCSLNEFRRFLGLKPYSTFEEWNPDAEIASTARKLYRDIENLELYVGLVAEESKPVMDGAGLCPSYTMSRAILADAVALVRGDRHLTYDFTPFNLTAWGFTECNRNTENAGWGNILGRLLARALPNHYNDSSVYTHFPLITPSGQPHSMDKTLKKLGLIDQYSIERPTEIPGTVVIDDVEGVLAALTGRSVNLFKTRYGQNAKDIGLSPSILTLLDKPTDYAALATRIQSALVPDESLNQVGTWFYNKTVELLREKSYTLVSKTKHSVDVVKDVFRLVPVHWASTLIAGLPLKSASEPRGIYYEQQVYQMLTEIYTFVYFETETSLKIPARAEAKENVERLHRLINLSLHEAQGKLGATVISKISSVLGTNKRDEARSPLKRILQLGSNVDEAANNVLAVIATAAPELSQIFTHVVNFYLAPRVNDDSSEAEKALARKKSLLQAKVVAVANSNAPDSATLLEGFVSEALRLDPAIPGVYREALSDGAVGSTKVKKGHKVWFNFAEIGSGFDADVEPSSTTPTPAAVLGDGVFRLLGEKFVYRVTAQVLKAVFSQKSVVREEGTSGTLRRFLDPVYTDPDVTDAVVRAVSPRIDVIERYTSVSEAPTPKAIRWGYLDPENAYRVTPWATGLLIQYSE